MEFALKVKKNSFAIKILVCFFFTLFSLFITASPSFALVKGLSRLYLRLTNPVEWFIDSIDGESNIEEIPIGRPSKNRSGKENLYKQNVIISNFALAVLQEHRQYGKVNDNIYLNLLTFYNSSSLENINAAYNLGCWVGDFHLITFDEGSDDWHFIGTRLDGISAALYSASWIINIPQRGLNKYKPLFKDKEFSKILLALIMIPDFIFGFIDLIFALIGLFVNGIIGCIWHPSNTLCSIGGGIFLLLRSFITAISYLF
jgi:hypothetical protein